MAKTITILLLGSLGLLSICSQVSAGRRQHIEPIVSTVYYLQDYCNPPETPVPTKQELLEAKYRHRRSASDADHDHDHDHDNLDDEEGLYGISEDIHQTIKYYSKKGIRKVKNQIKREMKLRRKWKQVFLDPVSQPSIVLRLWRADSVEQNQEHGKLLEDAPLNAPVYCKLLLRISGNSSNETVGPLESLANSTIGAVVNFLKFNQKPWLNDYRLRIITSDPNSTQYWLSGKKLNTGPSGKTHLPMAIDIVTHPQIKPEPLAKEDLSLLEMIKEAGKWLLIELETINQTLDDSLPPKKGTPNGSSKDNTELIINLYTQSSSASESEEDGVVKNAAGGFTVRNASNTQQCPIGTFDCAGDGLQCIPSGLRCNGEDNCGNRFDELFNCGTVNLYYIFGSDGHHSDYHSDGFWYAVRLLVLLFLVCLVLYTASLLCRCCCGANRGVPASGFINGRSPMIYLRSPRAGTEPLLQSFGPTAGRAMKTPGGPGGVPSGGVLSGRADSPPPSYFGNQADNTKSNVHEYIYVNNNYGQPQGSTTVNTSVRPSRDNINNTSGSGGPSAPPMMDHFPPMYPNIDIPNYGSTASNKS